jgi:hypothetical protein
MSRSYWRLIVATIGLVLAGGANAQDVAHHSGHDATTQQAHQSPSRAVPPSIVTPLQDSVGRIARVMESQKAEADTSEEKNRTTRDLKAQEDMAKWAFAMIIVGGFELAITAVGVVLVLLTLWETRRIGEAQVRAYVSIKSAEIEYWGTWENPRIKITAFNSGQSPARNFVWNPTVDVKVSAGQRLRQSYDGNWLQEAGADIAATSDLSDESPPPKNCLLGDFIAGIEPPPTMLFVLVRISFNYSDVFRTRLSGEHYFFGLLQRERAAPPGERIAKWQGEMKLIGKPVDWNTSSESEDNA